MTSPSSPKKVVVLALPGARELDLASVLDVFTQANWQLAPDPVYQVEVVTSDANGRVTGMTGLKLVGNVPYFACTGKIDTLLIAGGVSLVRSDPEEPSLVAWLRNRAFECRRVGSICTGAFVLARAGLLDGKRATTHWEYAKELAIRFPRSLSIPILSGVATVISTLQRGQLQESTCAWLWWRRIMATNSLLMWHERCQGSGDRNDRPSISRERALLRLHRRNRHAVDRRRRKFGEE